MSLDVFFFFFSLNRQHSLVLTTEL